VNKEPTRQAATIRKMQERRNQQKLVLNKASINFDEKRETEETRDKNTTK